MNKRNFVYNYIPLKSDFDDLQNDMESGIKDVASAVGGKGILSGMEVSIVGSEATVSPGVAYDGQGNQIAPNDPLKVPIGGITRPSAGRYKWVTVALRYEVKEQGQVVDGNNVTWPAQLVDSFSLLLLEGTEGTSATASKPDHLDWQVPLLDIRVDHSSPWENLVTETNRRPVLIPIAQASSRLRAHTGEQATADHAVHGIRQGAGNDFDADTLDGKHLSEIYTAALNAAWPVGASCIQFPGAPAPAALGLPGTWAAQFENEGVTFRTPGGHALAFGAGIQEDAGQRIRGDVGMAKVNGLYGWKSGAFSGSTTRTGSGAPGGGSDPTMRLTFDSAHSTSPNRAKTSDYETRMRNRTFRVWKRIS